MIKRLNKVTSLLVAATAMSSLMPAAGVMAADYKRIESKDGTIYEAVAYKDGNFYIDGDVKDGENDGAYLLSNGKYTDLEDVDTGSDVAIYGDKYLNVDNGDYFLDLSNGKVTDDDVEEDAIDDAATALRKAIKNKADDRYSDHDKLPTDELEAIDGNKFSEVWYEVSYSLEDKSDAKATVYSDAKGNYIDADYNLGKIKIEVGENTTAESVTLTNTEDTEKLKKNTNAQIGAEIVTSKVIAQDASYIYRTATIKLTSTDDTVVFNSANGIEVNKADNTIKVLQKISKAQASDDIDGAKYAKTVTTYSLDADQAALFDNAEGVNAVGNVLLVFNVDGSDIEALTLEFKSIKGNYTLEANDSDDLENIKAYDVDAKGNLWVLQGGFIYKFNNDEEFEKVYKVDGAMEKLSVYDADNIVTWNEDDEVYSIISGKAATTEEEEPETTIKTGWVQNSDGTWNYFNNEGKKVTGWLQSPASGLWYFMDANGVMMSNGWIKDNGSWYYLNADGSMKTGWLLDNGTWYFLKNTSGNLGSMQTGWIQTGGKWYYLNASGAMLKNTTVNGYRLGADGAWIK